MFDNAALFVIILHLFCSTVRILLTIITLLTFYQHNIILTTSIVFFSRNAGCVLILFNFFKKNSIKFSLYTTRVTFGKHIFFSGQNYFLNFQYNLNSKQVKF